MNVCPTCGGVGDHADTCQRTEDESDPFALASPQLDKASAPHGAIKKALAAIKVVDDYFPHADFLGPPRAEMETIRSVLEAAQQEAEAWEAIETWNVARGCLHRRKLKLEQWRDDGPKFWVLFLDKPFRAATRLEALTKAAAWCRAELAK